MIRRVNLHIVLLLMVGLVVFLIKCTIVYPIKYVGHADAAAYAEMADSLIHGRGFEVDYISWYFVKYDPKIVRPEDHWPPLYSMAIAPFFLILGKTAFAAKLPSLIISCFLLPLVIYSLAKELSGSKFPGLVAGLGIMLYPVMFKSSLYCLSDVIYTFVICAGVLFSAKALDNDKFFYPMGIFMGLAYYAKGSGLVPIPGYILFHVIARRSIRKVFTNRRFLLSLLIAFLILLPWLIRNYVHFGDPLFSTQRFSAGYVGYENWETGTYELYWGEKPPPSYFDKFGKGIGYVANMTRDYFKRYIWWIFMDINKEWGKLSEDDFLTYFASAPAFLGIVLLGFGLLARMTREYLKYIWGSFVDIHRRWGRFSRDAFLYFMNILAALGKVLLWGNQKRHAIWIIAGSLVLFLSAGWSPIYRLALPMIPLMMALGWATYFSALKAILKLLSKIPFKRIFDFRFLIFDSRLSGLIVKYRMFFTPAKAGIQRISLDMIAGLMVCCLAMPVVILSTESVQSAIKKSGYPYREGAQEWMDMGRWLRENAPPDSITMTRNPWELHFYSEQLAVQIPRASLEKTIEVMRFYKPTYIIPQLDIRPSLKSLVEGGIPGLELVYDNKKIQLYRINYDLLPKSGKRD